MGAVTAIGGCFCLAAFLAPTQPIFILCLGLGEFFAFAIQVGPTPKGKSQKAKSKGKAEVEIDLETRVDIFYSANIKVTVRIEAGVNIRVESKVNIRVKVKVKVKVNSLPPSQGPANIVSMQSVPPSLRGLAIAASTVVTHMLGDVPSPPILGLLQVTTRGGGDVEYEGGVSTGGGALVMLCGFMYVHFYTRLKVYEYRYVCL